MSPSWGSNQNLDSSASALSWCARQHAQLRWYDDDGRLALELSVALPQGEVRRVCVTSAASDFDRLLQRAVSRMLVEAQAAGRRAAFHLVSPAVA